MWMPKGKQVEVPSPGQNQKVPVFGAVNYATGKSIFHVPIVKKGGKNSRELLVLFDKLVLRARRTGKRIVLVIDNGPIHTAKRVMTLLEDSQIKKLMQVIWLPEYSPNLNDQEKVWKYVKSAGIANVIFTSKRSLRSHVIRVLGKLNNDSKKMMMIVLGKHSKISSMPKYLWAAT